MHSKYIIFFILFWMALISGCKTPMTPEEISDKFWLGVKTKNVALIKKYSAEDTIANLDSKDTIPQVKTISFGKIIIDGEIAEIETILTIILNEKLMDLNIETHLKKINGQWKVDYDKTMRPLTINHDMAELLGGVEALSQELADEIKNSVEEFKEKALPEIKSKMEEAEKEIREKLPELKNIIDEFLKDLEKSIEESIPVEEEVKTQET